MPLVAAGIITVWAAVLAALAIAIRLIDCCDHA